MSYKPTQAAIAGRATLGARIRAEREARGLSQEQLALTAGFDRSFLSDLESGRHSCMVDRVFDLAEALGVDASSLLDGSHPPD